MIKLYKSFYVRFKINFSTLGIKPRDLFDFDFYDESIFPNVLRLIVFFFKTLYCSVEIGCENFEKKRLSLPNVYKSSSSFIPLTLFRVRTREQERNPGDTKLHKI